MADPTTNLRELYERGDAINDRLDALDAVADGASEVLAHVNRLSLDELRAALFNRHAEGEINERGRPGGEEWMAA